MVKAVQALQSVNEKRTPSYAVADSRTVNRIQGINSACVLTGHPLSPLKLNMNDWTAWNGKCLCEADFVRQFFRVVHQNGTERNNRCNEENSIQYSNCICAIEKRVYAQLHDDLDGPKTESTKNACQNVNQDTSANIS